MRFPWPHVIVGGVLGICSPPPDSETTTPSDPSDPQRTCCKVCKKGKACGDSCIAYGTECHRPPGCAC